MATPDVFAKTAREKLSAALNALQESADTPVELLELAEPIAQAMGILHKVERSKGADLTGKETVLANVRGALDKLQNMTMSHPALDAVMEQVAGSLASVHQLARAQPVAAAPAPAPAQPAPPPAPKPAAPAPQPAPAPAPAKAPNVTQPLNAAAAAVANIPPPPPQFAPAAPPVAAPVVAPAPAPAPIAFTPSFGSPPVSPTAATAPVSVPMPAFGPPPASVQSPPASAKPSSQTVRMDAGAVQAGLAHAAPQPHVAPPAPPHSVPQPSQGFAAPAPVSQPTPVQRTVPHAPPSQPGHSQPGNSQPGYSQPGNSQPGHSQPGAPVSNRGSAPGRGSSSQIGNVVAELGTHSASNFYKGLGGNDVIEHGGIFVATYRIPKIGTPVNLRVLLPGDYEFQASGVVQWIREASGDGMDPGFGARFTQITPEGRQLVYRYTRNREPMFYDDL
ncbi:MAG: hypothetical protein U0271_29210 [Polyangiaceae bacterium]